VIPSRPRRPVTRERLSLPRGYAPGVHVSATVLLDWASGPTGSTDREEEILNQVALELTDSQIAARLYVGPKIVNQPSRQHSPNWASTAGSRRSRTPGPAAHSGAGAVLRHGPEPFPGRDGS